LGRQCGYQIGLDHNCCEDTRITYVTTGVLLQKLIGERADENFNKVYTHIILDEVHERDLDTDFILLLIKMKSLHKLNAKIIIMSATMDTSLFIDYFKKTKSNERESIPHIINIESQTYKVTEKYWEDLITDEEIFSIDPTKSFRNRLINQSTKLLGSKYISGNRRTREEYGHFDNENKIIRELKTRIVKKEFDLNDPDMSEEQIIMVRLINFFLF
jgi:HrpA-like RNA helicase